MNLFIESPRQRAESLRSEEHDAWLRALQEQYAARALTEASPGGTAAQREQCAQEQAQPDGSYSVSQASYRDELAFHARRVRRRKVFAVARAVALAVLIPVLLVTVFLASYVMTCVVNGASPDEVMELLRAMPARVAAFLQALFST